MRKIIEKSSDGLTTSGFEKLEKSPIYLYQIIDILLDTTLLNTALFEHGLVMTASAMVIIWLKRFSERLAKMNRNFLVRRGLTPREMLESSKVLSEYIGHLLLEKSRSVWIAQREGRTKDGMMRRIQAY
jgi:hypothetical protein